jgi:hypothetical protein
MAFAEVVTLESTPGTVQNLSDSLPIDSNFLIQNLDLAEDDVRPWGNLLFAIYVPFPVQEYGVFRSVPLFNRAHLIFQPISSITGLNIVIDFYAAQNTAPQNIRLWVEN